MLKEFFWIVVFAVVVIVSTLAFLFRHYENIEKECAFQGKIAVKSLTSKGYVCIKSD
jgi:hypothetical protein